MRHVNNFSLITISLVISFILVTLSCSSFIHDKILLYDSAVFQLIGRMWADGYIPYKDIWELKGPAIFVPNALAFLLFRSSIGLYFIEIANFTITFFFVLKTYLLEFNKRNAYLLTFVTAFYYSVHYTGNSVAEYFLPLLSFSFYLLYKYIYSKKDDTPFIFPPLYAFVFGLSFGYCLMSRLTNAVGICAVALVLTIMIIKSKEWKNLTNCIITFFLGFLIITIPFFWYFYANDALEPMWYGTFLFGLEYSGNSGFDILSAHGIRHIFLRLANCYILIFVSILVILHNKQRKYVGIMWLTVAVLSTLMFLRLNSFAHYYQITLPYTIIIFIELNQLLKQTSNTYYTKLKRGIIFYLLLLGTIGAVNDIKNHYTIFHNYKNEELAVYDKIVHRLPQDYKKSFQAYDCDTELYLYFNINPAYPLAGGQSHVAHYGRSIVKKYQNMFIKGNAEYILVNNKADAVVQNVLNTRYKLLFTEKSTRGGLYYVYKLKTKA